MNKKQSELTVVTRTKDLCSYIMTVTQKCPKNFRYTYVSRLQNLAMNVIENIFRANPTLKSDAETILTRLGIPMSTAVDMFLNQVVLVGGIPFSVTVPKPPVDIDASQMTEAQLHAKLQRGYDDYMAGRTQNATDAFAKFRESHS